MIGGRLITPFVVLGALVASTAPASAAERVQLASFIVPTAKSQYAHSERAAITVYLDVPSVEHGEYVCAVSARLKEAVTKAAFRNPLPRKPGGDLDMAAVNASLVPLVREQVKQAAPSNIEVVEGSHDVLKPALAPKFRAQGCVVRTDLKTPMGTAGGD